MSLFSRFFGKQDGADANAGQSLTANTTNPKPLSLQILFPGPAPKDPQQILEALRAYHPSMAKGLVEIDPEISRDGNLFGLLGWGIHVIRLVGLDVPMPSEVVESCVAPAHYPQPLKAEARAHRSHVLLYYVGREESVHEQYVALAAVAGVFARLGAIVVLNESAHTSFPAAALSGLDADGDIFELLHTLPLAILYCGFVKYEVQDVAGVWMRTHGASRFGLLDFAALAKGHEEGNRYFGIFENTLGYLLNSGARLEAGHTMQIGQDEYLRVRHPDERELFLQGGPAVLVVDYRLRRNQSLSGALIMPARRS